MSKQMNESVKAAPETTEKKAEVLIKVKANMKYRGARAAWYERLQTLEGKPMDEVIKNLESDPPALYGARSKHAGKPEPVSGWIRFFQREDVVTIK